MEAAEERSHRAEKEPHREGWPAASQARWAAAPGPWQWWGAPPGPRTSSRRSMRPCRCSSWASWRRWRRRRPPAGPCGRCGSRRRGRGFRRRRISRSRGWCASPRTWWRFPPRRRRGGGDQKRAGDWLNPSNWWWPGWVSVGHRTRHYDASLFNL